MEINSIKIHEQPRLNKPQLKKKLEVIVGRTGKGGMDSQLAQFAFYSSNCRSPLVSPFN